MASSKKPTLTKEEKKALSDEAFKNGEGLKAKLVTFLVFVAILAICFVGFFFVINKDIGGFASECLTPAFKNVPLIKEILPE